MILIVDDNQQNIFSLKTLLTLHNFEVDTALSGEQALKKILKQSYSLIILDVQMPDMDGFEVAETISGYSKSKDIPIIFLSAVNTHKRFITKGYTSGGIDYVTKPFDPDILILKIRTFYQLSEQTKQLQELGKKLTNEIELRKEAESLLEKKVQERTRQLLSANERLEQSNRELQRFAFIASHDLQEPLRKIQSFSNLAVERHLSNPEKLKNDLTKVFESAGRLRTLIQDLLDYSKIFAEDLFKTLDLNQIINEVLLDLNGSVDGNQCNIEVSPLPKIQGISFQLRQAFQNLISNSIKFSRTNVPCRIKISGELVVDKSFDSPASVSGKYCRITVEDNGIGFSNSYNDKIFEIFQRLNGRSEYEGTGIGLSIVKKVVERHDGIISASGIENQGATFIMVLPVRHNNIKG